ncbi:MAG TPA: type II toxin-antitoxin system prevent-host-death family antitoxin [Pirellulaceae bacterium]|jgi:antitoxin YefM
MEAITYSAANSNLAAAMDKVCDDHSPVIIMRDDNRAVVMMSLDDYEALEETAYLLKSPANAKRLMESIDELERGNAAVRQLNFDE